MPEKQTSIQGRRLQVLCDCSITTAMPHSKGRTCQDFNNTNFAFAKLNFDVGGGGDFFYPTQLEVTRESRGSHGRPFSW